jgi:CDP-diacylglycerol---glycerol-3-phosphate 3-phosphatidyltransferase
MTVAAQEDLRRTLFNVPNQLTMLRLVLAVAVFTLIPLHYFLSAIVVFLIAASTDWIDGYYARKYGQVTQLGRILDPFVDKIIICGAFIMLAAEQPYSGIAGGVAVVVVAREMLVTALRSFIEQSGGDFSASKAGKWKMVFQCAAAVASMAVLMLVHQKQPAVIGSAPAWLDWLLVIPQKQPSAANAVPAWLGWSLVVLVWTAVLLTIYSGAGYVAAAVKFLREPD